MNGIEKIELVKKFVELSDDKKEDLYNKYGKNSVEEEIKRCNAVDAIMGSSDTGDAKDKIDKINGGDLAGLFNLSSNVKMSNKIIEDIKKLIDSVV